MKWLSLAAILGLFLVSVCKSEGADKDKGSSGMKNNDKYEKATFAGGCFWCMEPPFENLEGVIDVAPGYSGGQTENPTYEQVSSGNTGHLEAVQITYDPSKINYQKLVDVFWTQIDPTDQGGQFVDRGSQYKTAIFYHDDEQKRIAEESKARLEKSGRYSKPIITEIRKYVAFYEAEDYHGAQAQVDWGAVLVVTKGCLADQPTLLFLIPQPDRSALGADDLCDLLQ